MLRIITLLTFLFSALVSAKEFPADYMDAWQSQKVDFSKTEWLISHPSPNRIFLIHQRLKTFVMITEHASSVPVESMEQYFAGPFTAEALKSREKFLRNESGVLDLDGGSNTHMGVRYGGVGFKVAMDEGIARFHERMWAEKDRLWHISLVSFESSAQDGSIHGDLNYLMEKISDTPVKTSSFFNILIPEAHAAADARCRINEEGQWRQLAGIIPKVKQESKCNGAGIAAANRGNSSGIKLNLSSLNGCVEGPPAAWNAMKQGFLSGLNSLANATEERIERMGCERLKPPKANGIWQSITNSFAMQAYTDCLQAAATGALVSSAFQAVKSTLSGIRDLYNWVRAGNNPWSAAVAIVSKEVNGFLCMNAAAQAKVVCEYATHFFIAMGVVVATAATGGALAPVAGVGAAARVALATQRGVAAAKAFIATPYTATRTIVRAPVAVAARVAARRDGGAGLVIAGRASATPRGQVARRPAAVPTPVRRTPAPTPKPRRVTAAVTDTNDSDAVADLNRRSLLETRQRDFDSTLTNKNLNTADASARIREVGIENYLEEQGDLFTASEKTRLTALYKDIYPEAPTPFVPAGVLMTDDAGRFEELRRAANLSQPERLREASTLLNRPLTPEQAIAIREAHEIGADKGHGFFNYSDDEITQKGLRLRAAGFTAPEIRILMEKGITGKFSEAISDATSNGVRADDLGRALVLRSTRDPATPVDLTEYNQTRIATAQSYRAAGPDSPMFYNESARQYILGGDANAATSALEQGIKGGMDPAKIIRGYRDELKNKEAMLRVTPNDPVLKQEVVARLKVVTALEDKYTPKKAAEIPKPKEVKPAQPSQPQQQAQKSPQEVSPSEAINVGNRLRLAGKPEEASHYYLRGASVKNFSDRNYHTAFDESLKGEGTVASQMLAATRSSSGSSKLNEFILEIYDRDLYRSPNPVQRANMNKLLKEVMDIPSRERGLYTPQENMMRAMLSATSN